MNGRLYDPVLHRFLQPDNYVQDPFNTQNFNRYGYVLNNPLKYNDPSGEEFTLASLVVIAIRFAVVSTVITIKENWPEIKDWINKQANNVGKWFEKQGNSIASWFKADTTPRTIATTTIPTNDIISFANMYPQHTNSFDGIWGKTLHFLTGGIENGAIYDRNGNFQSIAPQAGGGAIELIGGKAIKGSLSLVKTVTKVHAAKGGTKLLGTARNNLLNAVENPKLRNIVNDLYRQERR